MACPHKKTAIFNKKAKTQKDKFQKENQTYSNIVKKTMEQQQNQTQARATQIQLSSATHVSIVTCIIEAHMHNMIAPGSYKDRLNALLIENDLNPIKIPGPCPDSGKLFGATIVNSARGTKIPATTRLEESPVHSSTKESLSPIKDLPEGESDSDESGGESADASALAATSSSLSSAVSAASAQIAAPQLVLTKEEIVILETEKTRKGQRKKALPIPARHPKFSNQLNLKIYSDKEIGEETQPAIGQLLEHHQKHNKFTYEDPMRVVYHPKVNENIDSISRDDVISLVKRGLLNWDEVTVFSNMDVSKIKSGMVDSIPDRVESDEND